jgi:hypothetical protein
MKRKFIPVEESFAECRKNPEFVREYDALEEEFARAAALIDECSQAENAPAETRRSQRGGSMRKLTR